ncbi:hypothetical protein [Streptomyces sp. NPDC055105]|uniref:hypothetical protein n=1 Tax=Streptomyces sp. NPDC055105 TaxID=3365719 RepID=UPI0037D36520
MSAYEVAKFCRNCLRDPELRALAQSDPVAGLDRFDLTDQERAHLLAGEVGRLYEAGCSSFLLSYLPRWNLFGLDVSTYAARMRSARRIELGAG